MHGNFILTLVLILSGISLLMDWYVFAELKTPPQNLKTLPDTLEKKKMMDVKLIALLAKFKKVREFAAGPKDAKAQVNIKVEFGTLNLKE